MPERGDPVPRQFISYWCANGHETRPSFAIGAEIPHEWECPRCGQPAGTDEDNPPQPTVAKPFKTHLAYVMERRSAADGEALLEEALASLRANRDRH